MAQILLWVSMIAPWFILFFLDKKKLKRFLSAAFFTILLTSIFWQTAEVENWWDIKNNLFFLTTIPAFTYGFTPVITLLIFYFTFHNAWLFFGVNLVLDFIQGCIISPFVFEKLGYYQMNKMSNFGLFLLLYSFVPIIYLYQKWYDKE
ncbi:hypothetical protein OXPF_09480 [Oxobacter pfennigii]|uniref:Lycopene cyclase domain-containing protein n=1 Tax=Oxobacter pfennigii TaxID=36849 RepID=A0A0P8Z0N8_9CLOT|nr:hypothetical protein [Oxobacter pfennigii]KPU45715.1 hypothetical protein OXPF_09480 [Oxobacter pfennigii]